MKTDNELIAEFMGCKTLEHQPHLWKIPGIDWPFAEFQMLYATSWDWLMPVVEKIVKLFDEAFPPGEEFVKRILAHEEPIEKEYMDVVGLPIGTPIQEVYQTVVTFIKWYNENKKQ